MAALDITPRFGAELKDGFKPVNAWVSGGIGWLEDVQQFYRERSVIEKEYSAKLSALAKKYFEKKARRQSSLSVGDTPTQTPGSLESASMTTWSVQLSTLESRAAEHDRFASDILSNLAEPLRLLGVKCEELRKQHAEYSTKLEKDKEISYAELKKVKSRYDGTCQEVENRRKKVDSAFDHSKQKAQSAFQQHQIEMHNTKNTYLISINVTNKHKERHYHEYVPDLVDSLQDLSESRVAKLNSIWAQAAQMEASLLSRSSEFVNHLSSEIPRNNPLLDSMMFVRHNASNWQEPADFVFEPAPVWLDDGSMATTEPAKVFLRNILSKSKGQISELRYEVDKKRKEVDGLKKSREQVREGKEKKDELELTRATFALQGELHDVEKKKTTAEIEVATIVKAVGDVSIGGRSHNFKSQTFKIPTNCDLCGERIWGLSAKGFDCRDCGFTCHSKCEMKVPADCPGESNKEERRRLKVERQEMAHAAQPVDDPIPERQASGVEPSLERRGTVDSMNTLSSDYSANANNSVSGTTSTQPTSEDGPLEAAAKPSPVKKATTSRPRVLAPPPARYVGNTEPEAASSTKKKARMLYSYEQNGQDEISVDEGKEVTIIEPDDGSGWMKIRAGAEEGLVPAAYAEAIAPNASHSDVDRNSNYSASSVSLAGSVAGNAPKKKGPAVAPKKGAKKLQYAQALYDYSARSDAEHSINEGERFVLINRDAGGGWADVEKNGAVKSVPANYIEEA